MVYREVPAYRYAVFTHHGKLDNLHDTFDYIFSTGLPQAGLQAHPSGFNMEVYKDDFKLGADDSKMYIYVALQA
jgi:predicted transcriptional regulator YdeE